MWRRRGGETLHNLISFTVEILKLLELLVLIVITGIFYIPGAAEMEAQYEGRLFMQQTLAEQAQVAVGGGHRRDGSGQSHRQHGSRQGYGGKLVSLLLLFFTYIFFLVPSVYSTVHTTLF